MSRFSLADSAKWEMKDSTRSRLASLDGLRTAKIRCVRLHQRWIEVVLPDEKAQLIAQPGLIIGPA